MQMPESQRVFVGATTKPLFTMHTDLHGTRTREHTRELHRALLTEMQDGFLLHALTK